MRDNRRISIEKLTDYFERYCAGESIQSITAEINMKPNTLTCKFKNAGLKKLSISPHAHLNLEQIYNEHTSGIMYKDLAIKYRIQPKTLRHHLKLDGYQSDKDRVIRIDLFDAWRRYENGEKIKDIAIEKGLNDKELSRRLSAAGFKKERNIDNFNFDDIEKLRLEYGGDLKRVAEKKGLCLATIKRWYYNRGLSIRGFKLKDENFFTTIDSAEKAYYLGFIYADGYLSEDHHFVRIKINKTDIDILQHSTLLLFDGIKEIPYWMEDGREVCVLLLVNKTIAQDLKKHGVHQRKAFTIKFPDTVPPEFMNHFIRGYFDGDGSVYIVKKGPFGNIIRTGFVCSSYEFICALRDHFISLGLHPTKLFKSKNTYRMNIGRKQDMVKIRDYLYSNAPAGLYLKRKFEKFQNIDDGNNNPHLNKFTETFRQGIARRITKLHQEKRFSRYKNCVIKDVINNLHYNGTSIKDACEKCGINYSSAKVIWRRNPEALYLGRYSFREIKVQK